MPLKNSEPRLERRKLTDLVPYPKQAEYFDDIPDVDLQGLARAMREGRVPPIEVLPRNRVGMPVNTILRGHQRLRALLLNGTSEVEVSVRYDLAEADEAAVEKEFLEDGLYRRQLDPLCKARVALRLYQLARKRPERDLSSDEVTDARDRIGMTIGMSGRNLQRYWSVLLTPVEVQNAFRAGQLSLVVASRVAGLRRKAQAEIAERIKAGRPPAEVVAEYIPAGDGKHRDVRNALASFVRSLERGLLDLEGRHRELSRKRVARYVPVLRKARVFMKRLIEAAEEGDAPENGRAE